MPRHTEECSDLLGAAGVVEAASVRIEDRGGSEGQLRAAQRSRDRARIEAAAQRNYRGAALDRPMPPATRFRDACAENLRILTDRRFPVRRDLAIAARGGHP